MNLQIMTQHSISRQISSQLNFKSILKLFKFLYNQNKNYLKKKTKNPHE